MSEPAAILSASAAPGRALHGLVQIVQRYAFSILGPISVSAAHFLASLILLRELPPVHFGQFAFLLVVTPFLSMSAGGALLLAPLAAMVARDPTPDSALSTLRKVSLMVAVFAGVATFVLLLFSRTPLLIAAILAPYATFTALRWFGRGYLFAQSRPAMVMLSDLAYSVSLSLGLIALVLLKHFDILSVAELLVLASVIGMVALGGDFLKKQFWQLGSGTLDAYRTAWMEFTRWSVAGVLLSELTANAHAYLVTFYAGPKAFAILAVGSLVMRPVSLVLSALPDFERPRMARALAARDSQQAFRCVNEFRTAGGAIWAVTLGLAAVLLLWFPNTILRDNYDVGQVLVVIAIWAVIMAARVLRTPEAILLQSAGEFKPLASVSTKSSIISVVATLLLLLTFGPLTALGGILAGELVMTIATVSLFRSWKAQHV